mmetsp:Transcript_20632/g.41854  ORF Transcript_20632/g.41854 Transcript_20632/m.41854 type:complete len:393 (+) Transcript_20632:463-1641(+)
MQSLSRARGLGKRSTKVESCSGLGPGSYHVGCQKLWRLFAGEEAHLEGDVEKGLAVLVDGGLDEVGVLVAHVVGVGHGGAEVDQVEGACLGVVEEVGPVRVGLHQVELEELPQRQAQHAACHVVTHLLRHLRNLVEGHAREELCGEDPVAAQLPLHPRHPQPRVIRQQPPHLLRQLRLQPVVCLHLHRVAELLEGGGEEEPARGKRPDKRPEIGDVRVNAVRHTRVLDLDRHLHAVVGDCPVHLPDAGGGHGLVVEVAEFGAPVATETRLEGRIQLLRRHLFGFLSHAVDHLPQRRVLGDDVFVLDAEQLPELQRRPAHTAQRHGQTVAVRLVEHKTLHTAFAHRPTPDFSHELTHSAHGHPEAQSREACHALELPGRHTAGFARIGLLRES